ncbi:hypothetical protein PQI66_12460 [Corynebacterium sp. USCH3]|uniref:hypothetical protein n=1 Tax=Corynebacterium sp. USCH3 TaxID=3024840 RepID=UPI0030AC6A09
MKVRRKSTALALATGAALILSACGGSGEAEESSAAPRAQGASASESAAATSQPPAYPTTEDPEHYAVDNGGYMFTLPDGGVCSIDGALNDEIGSDFACLLTLEEPMETEDGEPTSGLEYRDTMFAPSAALADPQLQQEFSGSDAEVLGPQSELTVGGFRITVETEDEYGFGGKGGGDFFVAVQHVTRFWTPRPDWVPEPNFPPIG